MKIELKSILVILIVALLVGVVATGGCFSTPQENGGKTQKVYKVGILSGLNLFINISDSFKEEMTRLGYVEGKNIVYDTQKTNYEPDKEQQILKKFIDDKVDLIFGFNTEVALAAKNATKGTGIPVVFANAFIEGNNLVDSVRTPGGNITGVRYPGTYITVKRLEILHEIVPQAKRIWVPYQNGYPSVPSQLTVLRPAAASLGVTLIEFPCDNLTHLKAELEKRSESGDLGFDAVLFIPESLSTTREAFAVIAKVTREHKIPVGGSSVATEDYGTVFAVTVNNDEIGRLAAHSADKVLKGTPAGTIPVVSAESCLKINYKVSQELGLNVSEGLLGRASEIIR